MRTVKIAEAKARFSALLAAVEAGEEIAITRHGRVIARLVPDASRMADDLFRPCWDDPDISKCRRTLPRSPPCLWNDMPYLLDTNIFIAAMRGAPGVRRKLATTPLSDLLLSPAVLGELQVGVQKSRHRDKNAAHLARLTQGI